MSIVRQHSIATLAKIPSPRYHGQVTPITGHFCHEFPVYRKFFTIVA